MVDTTSGLPTSCSWWKPRRRRTSNSPTSWLPADHDGAGKNIPPRPEEVADGDRALGLIVEYLSRLSEGRSMAIFIMPDDAQSTRDHVNAHRTYAIIVSPYARCDYVGRRHLSTVSVLKTEEEILGLPALSLGNALASDMRAFFTAAVDHDAHRHIDVSTQTARVEGRRIAALLAQAEQIGLDEDARVPALGDLAQQADRLANKRGAFGSQEYERHRRLTEPERAAILEPVHSEHFYDRRVREIRGAVNLAAMARRAGRIRPAAINLACQL
jgi:hypothetical protein